MANEKCACHIVLADGTKVAVKDSKARAELEKKVDSAYVDSAIAEAVKNIPGGSGVDSSYVDNAISEAVANKADVSYVHTAIAEAVQTLPDVSYVDNVISEAVANKADTSYVDESVANKLDKITTSGNRIYAKVGGNQTSLPFSKDIQNNAIIQRTETGNVRVPLTPENNNEATSKEYVDNAVRNASSGVDSSYVDNAIAEAVSEKADTSYVDEKIKTRLPQIEINESDLGASLGGAFNTYFRDGKQYNGLVGYSYLANDGDLVMRCNKGNIILPSYSNMSDVVANQNHASPVWFVKHVQESIAETLIPMKAEIRVNKALGGVTMNNNGHIYFKTAQSVFKDELNISEAVAPRYARFTLKFLGVGSVIRSPICVSIYVPLYNSFTDDVGTSEGIYVFVDSVSCKYIKDTVGVFSDISTILSVKFTKLATDYQFDFDCESCVNCTGVEITRMQLFY